MITLKTRGGLMRNLSIHPNYLAFLLLLTLTACVGNPTRTAQQAEDPYDRIELTAYSVVAQYRVAIDKAANLMIDPQVPNKAKRAIQKADAEVTPIVLDLEPEVNLFKDVRRGLKDSDRPIEVIAANLQRWTQELQDAMPRLERAIGGGE